MNSCIQGVKIEGFHCIQGVGYTVYTGGWNRGFCCVQGG